MLNLIIESRSIRVAEEELVEEAHKYGHYPL